MRLKNILTFALLAVCIQLFSQPKIDSVKITSTLCYPFRYNIEIFVSGGVPPYTFIWTGIFDFYATTQNIYNLYPGIYTLKAKDSEETPLTDPNNGLYLIMTLDIMTLSIDTSHFGSYNISCHGCSDGWIEVGGGFGNGNFRDWTYKWTDPKGFTKDGLLVTNLSAGLYILEVWDTANCYYRHEIYLREPDAPVYYDTIQVDDTTFVYDTTFIEVFDTITVNDTVTETMYKVVYNYIDTVITTELLDTVNYVSALSTSESNLVITNHNTELRATEAWEWANIYDLKGNLLKTTLSTDRVNIADLEPGIYLFIVQTKTGYYLRFKFFKY